MREADYMKRLYKCEYSEDMGVAAIDENSKRSRIKHLNISCPPVPVLLVKEKFYDQVGNLMTKASGCTRNADGVVMFDGNNGATMLFCEMKSSDGGVRDSAFIQVSSSYIKTFIALSACDGVDVNNVNIYFVFTAQNSGDLAIRTAELDEAETGTLNLNEQRERSLLHGETVTVKVRDLWRNCPNFHPSLIDKDVVCMLKTSDNDTVTFDASGF